MKWRFLIVLSIFFSLLYFSQLFVIYVNQLIFEKEMTTFCYALPMIIICSFGILLFLSKKVSESIYGYIYTIFGVCMGYLLYICQIAIIVRILFSFFSLSQSVNALLLYISPLIICIYGIINALKTKIKRITLKCQGYKDKITILHLTDIHLGAIHQKNSVIRIVKETQELEPDIVVITGDMADGSLKVKPDWLMPFDDLAIPILYVTGNHENMNPKVDMINAVNSTQIKYIGRHGNFKYKGINFIGEDFGYDLRKCLLEIKQEEGVPNVLLSHVPILYPDELQKYNIFLFLAGHTHGGQLFPFQILVYYANACFSGLYSDKNKKHHVYVSEGVNNALVPMRVGSSRIFPLITIEGEN